VLLDQRLASYLAGPEFPRGSRMARPNLVLLKKKMRRSIPEIKSKITRTVAQRSAYNIKADKGVGLFPGEKKNERKEREKGKRKRGAYLQKLSLTYLSLAGA